MHSLYILLFKLVIIYVIEFLIKPQLIYVIHIIMMIFLLNLLDFVYYMLHQND